MLTDLLTGKSDNEFIVYIEVDDILNHDQYQLDLAESMGSMLNENSVSSIDSNEASTSSIVVSALDDESCLVCGELARTGTYIK